MSRPDLSRHRTVASGTLYTSPLESFASNLPDFLQTGSSKFIPPTVTARGYEKSMPVAYEPVPISSALALPRPKGLGASAASTAGQTTITETASAEEKPNINRRSTMPSKAAMSFMLQPPPILYPSLTPSCDLCSSDLTDTISHCSHIYCLECEMYLCGSEPIDDGFTTISQDRSFNSPAPSPTAKPKCCLFRLHRHEEMQHHVRIPASTHMYFEKLSRVEEAKPVDDPTRKSKKDILLQLYTLPMKGITWEFQALTTPDKWIEFDVQTQALLEDTFITSRQSDAPAVTKFKLGEQYEVQEIRKKSTTDGNSSSSDRSYFLTNTLNMRKTNVRRLDVHARNYDSIRPIDRTPSLNRPMSASMDSPNTLRTRRIPSLQFDSSSTSSSTVPSPSKSTATTEPIPNGSPSTPARPTTAHRPRLARHASLDVRIIESFSEYDESAWRTFAKEQHKLAEGEPGTVGHELEDIADSRKEQLHPLYDMERGNPLLLVIYHNNFTGVLSLLKKGYSPNSITSWTKISALQLACLQGNSEIASTLIEYGADPGYKSTSSIMAIEYAVKSGNLKLVELLLSLRKQPPEGSSTAGFKRCVAYSDILLRIERKNRSKRQSAWIDIGAEEDETTANGSNGLGSISIRTPPLPKASPPPDEMLGDRNDPDYKLYPHLLTEALNVPPVLAHTVQVIKLLLDRMLERARTMDPPPEFELSRYHEWLCSCVSSASVERIRFLIEHRAHYTSHLDSLDEISQDFTENLSDPKYSHALLREQPSLDALFFQACHHHPASATLEQEEDDPHEHVSTQPIDTPISPNPTTPSGLVSPSSLSSHPFELLDVLLTSGANIDHIETDTTELTELSPFFMSLRDRKIHLTRFIIEHGSDPEQILRCVRLELPADHQAEPDQEQLIDDDGDSHWFRVMTWEVFVAEECGYDTDLIETTREAIQLGLTKRHEHAQRLIQTLIQLPPLQLPSSSSPKSSVPFHIGTLFPERVFHLLATYCFGSHALITGGEVSAETGAIISEPRSPTSP